MQVREGRAAHRTRGCCPPYLLRRRRSVDRNRCLQDALPLLARFGTETRLPSLMTYVRRGQSVAAVDREFDSERATFQTRRCLASNEGELHPLPSVLSTRTLYLGMGPPRHR